MSHWLHKQTAQQNVPTLLTVYGGVSRHMRFIDNYKFVILMTVGSLALWGHMFILSYIDDPRFFDNSLTYDEMYWWEVGILYQGLFCTFAIWLTSSYHCFKRTSKLLAILICMIWPLVHLYSPTVARTACVRRKPTNNTP